ncbi:hypothetical protein TIFTF001_012244 [Ficus carica]|uniref:Uncharacterized protein n=1 Tax=Ficus carica TaxID=3494 RepID=A0AA88A205_FICCA|nr:hypothetical protein TIFTF001_012244 [Ficus carica]
MAPSRCLLRRCLPTTDESSTLERSCGSRIASPGSPQRRPCAPSLSRTSSAYPPGDVPMISRR